MSYILGTEVRTDVALCDLDTNKPVSDKLRFIYIQLPRFSKNEEECKGIFDYWIYNIKNMETTNSIAFAQQHKIFKRLESVTNYANLDKAQRLAYDEDLKIYRDFQNCMDYKLEEGIKKGREEGIKKGEEKGREEERKNSIRMMASFGINLQDIADKYHIPLSEVYSIINGR